MAYGGPNPWDQQDDSSTAYGGSSSSDDDDEPAAYTGGDESSDADSGGSDGSSGSSRYGNTHGYERAVEADTGADVGEPNPEPTRPAPNPSRDQSQPSGGSAGDAASPPEAEVEETLRDTRLTDDGIEYDVERATTTPADTDTDPSSRTPGSGPVNAPTMERIARDTLEERAEAQGIENAGVRRRGDSFEVVIDEDEPEEFGDYDWSAGLGDPDRDEVEDFVAGQADAWGDYLGGKADDVRGDDPTMWEDFAGVAIESANVPGAIKGGMETVETVDYLAPVALPYDTETAASRREQTFREVSETGPKVIESISNNQQRALASVGLGVATFGAGAAASKGLRGARKVSKIDTGDFDTKVTDTLKLKDFAGDDRAQASLTIEKTRQKDVDVTDDFGAKEQQIREMKDAFDDPQEFQRELKRAQAADELPAREEFPDADAYEAELRRMQARQELPDASEYASRSEYVDDIERFAEGLETSDIDVAQDVKAAQRAMRDEAETVAASSAESGAYGSTKTADDLFDQRSSADVDIDTAVAGVAAGAQLEEVVEVGQDVDQDTAALTDVVAEETIAQEIEPTVDQTIDQTITQDIDQTITQDLGQSVDQTIDQTVDETIDQTITQPTIGEQLVAFDDPPSGPRRRRPRVPDLDLGGDGGLDDLFSGFGASEREFENPVATPEDILSGRALDETFDEDF